MEKKDAKRQRNDQTKLVEFFLLNFSGETNNCQKNHWNPWKKRWRERAGYGYKNLICIDTHIKNMGIDDKISLDFFFKKSRYGRKKRTHQIFRELCRPADRQTGSLIHKHLATQICFQTLFERGFLLFRTVKLRFRLQSPVLNSFFFFAFLLFPIYNEALVTFFEIFVRAERWHWDSSRTSMVMPDWLPYSFIYCLSKWL